MKRYILYDTDYRNFRKRQNCGKNKKISGFQELRGKEG